MLDNHKGLLWHFLDLCLGIEQEALLKGRGSSEPDPQWHSAMEHVVHFQEDLVIDRDSTGYDRG